MPPGVQKRFRPAIKVVVAGAAGGVSFHLLYRMGAGAVFGDDQPVHLYLLETPSRLKYANRLLYQLEQCAFPLVSSVVATAGPEEAFQDADVAVLLTAIASTVHGQTPAELYRNVKVFINHGMCLEEFSRRSCLVVVAGSAPAGTYSSALASVCAASAPSLPRTSFTAVSRQLQDWATAQVGTQMALEASAVTGVLVWGNCWGHSFLPDVNYATVTLPEILAGFKDKVQPVRHIVADDLWLKEELYNQLVKRQELLIKEKPVHYNLSTSMAITKHIHDLWQGTQPGESVSMAVFSDGPYELPPELLFSLPVQCKNRSWKITQLPIDAFVELNIRKMACEMLVETKRAIKVWEEEKRMSESDSTIFF